MCTTSSRKTFDNSKTDSKIKDFRVMEKIQKQMPEVLCVDMKSFLFIVFNFFFHYFMNQTADL